MIQMSDATGAADYDPYAVVRSFLHSVVVLDDRPSMSGAGDGGPSTSSAWALTLPDYNPPTATTGETVPSARSGAGLDASAVINGFADVGLVCAVLDPTPPCESPDSPDDTPPIRVTKAAVRADIVVIDWKIRNSSGGTALQIVKNILDIDRVARRFRLIAIYTGERKLQKISTKVQELLDSFYPEERLNSNHLDRISKGPVHVVILAKEGTIGDHGGSTGFSEVKEGELAAMLIDIFMSMTSGILPNMALAGVAAIRNRAHNVLAKFDRELDPAYLGHRILLPYPPDAEYHLVEALASELLSILEDHRPSQREISREIRVYLEQAGKLEWLDVLLRGLASQDTPLPQKKGSHNQFSKRDVIESTAGLFIDDSTVARTANRRFAALLGTKTRYPGYRSRRLSLGTIVYQINGDEQYFLCLQPKCDSIRLVGETGFPMIPLYDLEAHDEREARKAMEQIRRGQAIRLVLETDTDNWKDLYILPKPSELVVPRFKPGTNPPGEVPAIERAGVFYFKDANSLSYQWIAEIKDEHAFRVAGGVASALARPGPNDAEWLRRGVR